MAKNNQKYLDERAERLADEVFKLADKSETELLAIFTGTGREMSSQVAEFYGKYGKSQESPVFTTLPDGTKVITGYTTKIVVPPEVALSKQGSKVSRIEKLNASLNELIKTQTKEQLLTTTNVLKGIANTAYYDTMFTIYSSIGVGQSFTLLTPAMLNSLIKNPVNGADFVERTNLNNNALANRVNQTLRNGITQGLGIKDMTASLQKNMNIGYNDAKRIIQTEANNSMSQAAMESYKASGVVEEYIYIATLDSKTSDICTDLDGQTFPLDKAVTGLNFPPMHPNCRSTTGAYFKDLPALETRMARDAETGKNFYVPGDMNVKDFKAIYADKTITRSEWDKSR